MGSGSRGATGSRRSLEEGIVAGAVSIDCSARHELKMLPSVLLCALGIGGLAGGDAKSADWSLVTGGCDESHESADGMSILTTCRICFLLFICTFRAMALRYK